jgi:DinB superfamily
MTGNLEPWLRGTLTDVPAVPRAVLHALELAQEDIEKWCGGLTEGELLAQPPGLAPVAFHIRHIARSLDRLLTYAAGRGLSEEQLAALHTESDAAGSRDRLFGELASAFLRSAERIRAIDVATLEQSRVVGKKNLPTTVGGLLVHVADHTQRHVGQAIITAKVVLAERQG